MKGLKMHTVILTVLAKRETSAKCVVADLFFICFCCSNDDDDDVRQGQVMVLFRKCKKDWHVQCCEWISQTWKQLEFEFHKVRLCTSKRRGAAAAAVAAAAEAKGQICVSHCRCHEWEEAWSLSSSWQTQKPNIVPGKWNPRQEEPIKDTLNHSQDPI